VSLPNTMTMILMSPPTLVPATTSDRARGRSLPAPLSPSRERARACRRAGLPSLAGLVAGLGVGLGWLLLALAACGDPGAPSLTGEPPTPADAPSPAPEAPGRAVPVPRRSAGFLGVILARSEVDLSAEVPGPVREVLVRVGDRVAEGAVLAHLDTRDLEHRLAIERANLHAAEADKHQREIELHRAEGELVRRQALGDLVSREEVDEAAFERDTAGASLEAARARVGEARARLEQLEADLGRSVLRAPFSGMVAARYLDPGALVTAGTPILRLISADGWLVRFAVPPEEMSRIELGQTVEVRGEGEGPSSTGPILTGIVEHIAPQLDRASQMIFAEARLTLPTAETALLPSGTPVRVSLGRPGGR